MVFTENGFLDSLLESLMPDPSAPEFEIGWTLGEINLMDGLYTGVGTPAPDDSPKPASLELITFKTRFDVITPQFVEASAVIGRSTLKTPLITSANILRVIRLEYIKARGVFSGEADIVGKTPFVDLSGSEDKELVIDFIFKIR